MRTILLSRSDEVYLQKCAVESSFSYGLIIGQLAELEKYVVVHLAKNVEDEVFTEIQSSHEVNHKSLQVNNIDIQTLTNQWISAYKMIPGSFTVLGIFVSTCDASILNDETFKSARKLLSSVHKLLTESNSFYEFSETQSEYVIMAYSQILKKAICQLYSHSTNGGILTPMTCRFVEKPFEWHNFECIYELDEVFPVVDGSQKVNIEYQFKRTIESVKRNLMASEIFIQNDCVDDQLTVDAYVKKKTSNDRDERKGEYYKVNIYLALHCHTGDDYPVKVREYNGVIRFYGVISSRVWCNPKNTFTDVKRFVRDDILRSLAARIQVYCDGLTEPNVTRQGIFISEPPRRVYFSLAPISGSGSIQFCEYIFRGEAPTVAVAQAKQILDLDIDSEFIESDLEGLPDDETFSNISTDVQSATLPKTVPRDLNRKIYMLGITVALFVLVGSILVHYILNRN